jgi:hypothetical protein
MKCDRIATARICFFYDHREPIYLCADHLKKIQSKEPKENPIKIQRPTFRYQCQVDRYKPLEVKDEIQEF